MIFALSVLSFQEAIEPGVDPAPPFWHRFTAFRRNRGDPGGLGDPQDDFSGGRNAEEDQDRKSTAESFCRRGNYAGHRLRQDTQARPEPRSRKEKGVPRPQVPIIPRDQKPCCRFSRGAVGVCCPGERAGCADRFRFDATRCSACKERGSREEDDCRRRDGGTIVRGEGSINSKACQRG